MAKVCVICDPGANWRAAPGEDLWRGQLRFRRLIEAAAHAGADVFKPQFLRRTVYPEGSAEAELVARYEWPESWLPWLREWCEARGLEFMCTVYEPEHVPLIDPHVKRWKIASFEAQRPDLLKAVAATEKPLVVSTGMAGWKDAIAAVDAAVGRGYPSVTYLHCVSSYPARPEQLNLRAMGYYGPCGLSDHTTGTTAAVIAVALGATVIEKHVKTRDVLDGPDAGFALDPEQFRRYVAAIREAEVMLGNGLKQPQEGEWQWAKWQAETGKRGTHATYPVPLVEGETSATS